MNSMPPSISVSATSESMNHVDQGTIPSESSDPLEELFYYQNQATGNASGHTLSLRQLCRILAQGKISNVTADTLLYPLDSADPSANGSNQPWKPARSFPALAASVATWYYEKPRTAAGDSDQENFVLGPVNCGELSRLLRQGRDENADDLNVLSIRVYSDTVAPSWAAIRDLPNLQLALQALGDVLSTQSSDEQPPLTVTAHGKANKDQGPSTIDSMSAQSAEVQDELEAFLSSIPRSKNGEHELSRVAGANDDEGDMDEAYESDGGTRYVKNVRTGTWVHEALHARALSKATHEKPSQAESTTKLNDHKEQHSVKTGVNTNRKRKAKFSAKNARCWVYVTGLPSDTTMDEAVAYFSKAGILDLNPETQKPKIKLYTDSNGRCKGDASVCFARPESVGLAITLLDEAPFRPHVSAKDHVLHVEPAKFEAHADKRESGSQRFRASAAQRKVARLAALQAMDWDEGDINGRLTGGRKGLRIIVLKRLFDPARLPENEDEFFAQLERDLRLECEVYGVVEKITVFTSHPEGVVVCKFAVPGAASEAVKALNGKAWKENRIDASFWDGVADFVVRDTAREEVEEHDRLEEFGSWLESHDDLPEELRLKTE